ncbi:hypothetical protein P872_20120 [Rhodonellum psychrophilum GCM71 = DSM 17998]|uniref:Phosphoribosylformylglycinamidine synthase n=2 Tax=Rhodonellum TaxID=336827 RepID=U5BM77_9BACT|nr:MULTISPECIES: HAEPLYID family protein [Rhodonellum]ERM81595.1 hypothetical protein P872_20120 [Rhodonellum psychrophilum GCM71 = DSM 17998]
MKKILAMLGLCLYALPSIGQNLSDSLKIQKRILDSLFLDEIEAPQSKEKAKILHAEPLYIDLIRDLGARKGEKEWNFGFGMTDKNGFDEYEALVEYEWAPIDRLGFEIEVPLTVFSSRGELSQNLEKPSNRLESIKLATQWTFLVSEKAKTSLALGYIHEFEFVDLNNLSFRQLFKGNIYNPIFIAAKRWGSNYHTLIYTGPRIEKEFNQKSHVSYDINTNFHYMITGTRNFIGLEVNKEIYQGKMETVLRPQMRIGLSESIMVGIVTGIPLSRQNNGISSFLRIIYEPGFKAMH